MATIKDNLIDQLLKAYYLIEDAIKNIRSATNDTELKHNSIVPELLRIIDGKDGVGTIGEMIKVLENTCNK